MSNQSVGQLGEDLAAQKLADEGYEIVDMNWRCRFGEIDIIALSEQGELAFVEVRTRRTLRFGTPEESITPKKMSRMRRLAGLWLKEHEFRYSKIRLDLMAVRLKQNEKETIEAQLTHLRGIS